VDVELETIRDVEEVGRFMRALAPLRDASATSATTAIPRTVPLFSVIDVDANDGENDVDAIATRLVAGWNVDRGYSLTTPLGVSAEGVLALDLVAQGPHVLIGGTSGSGKSEFLVALVAGLIAHYSPERLALLFIDYKGGAATEVFKDAPHAVGYVTNLNADLANRALVSLRAELNKRMQLFSKHRAKDIEAMLQGNPDAAPPSLVIVVDEFATLVKEIPEFVDGIVDIAQRGRSLGIHLVLATQSPSQSVDDKIQANVTSRISLRMVDPQESTAVIGTPEAATIPVPLRGRAIARLGHGALIEFQSAYGGAAVRPPSHAELTVQPFVIGREVETVGKVVQMMASSTTQLQALLDAATKAAERLEIPPPDRPWRDELAEHIALDELDLADAADGWGLSVAIGQLDDPATQSQYAAIVDLEDSGGLIIYGAGGSGKTTTLRTIAISALSSKNPLVLYVIDFASGALRDMEHALAACAAVARGDDLEATTRVLALIEEQINRRYELFGSANADGIDEYRASVDAQMPRILLLVDGYGAMRETFQGYGVSASTHQWLDRFHRLVTTGRKVGVHVVITADRPVPPAIASAMSRTLVLRQASEQAYAELGVPTTRTAGLDLAPGRGLLDGRVTIQVATVGSGTQNAEQLLAIRQFGARSGDTPPPALRTRALRETEHLDVHQSATGFAATIGIADVTLAPVVVHFADEDLVVAGPSRSGRSSTLAIIADSLRRNGVDVYLGGAPHSGLRSLCETDRFAGTAFESEELAQMIQQFVAASDTYNGNRILLLDDIEQIEEMALTDALRQLARSQGARLAVTLETRSLSSGFYPQTDVFKRLKDRSRRLLLQPADELEVRSWVHPRAQLRPGIAMPQGRGVLATDGSYVVVQLAARS
jgi:S-DNA-T family DNA segregation ATPase FtsK/SpoIIIE